MLRTSENKWHHQACEKQSSKETLLIHRFKKTKKPSSQPLDYGGASQGDKKLGSSQEFWNS